jgi:CheY-like chemotaxis protein
MTKDRVLLVDDEQPNLDLYQLLLRSEFELLTASCATEALEVLARQGELPIIVSDMHLPGTCGIELLEQVHERWPETIRIMITADVSQAVAVEASNRGRVFRFLNKPCSRAGLLGAVRDGLAEYRRRHTEKELLASTANGCITLLGEVLSVVSPLAFAKATRVARTVEQLCEQLKVGDAWEMTMAATLSQLGCISLPEKLMTRVARREPLSRHSAELWRSHPQVAHDLIVKIPRLERVAEIVLGQQTPYERTSDDPVLERRSVRWRAGCLGAALEYDSWVELSNDPQMALGRLELVGNAYPPDVIQAFAEVMRIDTHRRSRLVMLNELTSGMVLLENLVDPHGRVLLTNGQRISELHISRLFGLGYGSSVRQPVRVLCTAAAAAATADTVDFAALQLQLQR